MASAGKVIGTKKAPPAAIAFGILAICRHVKLAERNRITMNIHEHQAKQILSEFGAPIAKGATITDTHCKS